eukprot:5900360-Alexandrium_andersonii.AAC.1
MVTSAVVGECALARQLRGALFLSECAALLAGCDLNERASVQIGVVDVASDSQIWCGGEAEDADL